MLIWASDQASTTPSELPADTVSCYISQTNNVQQLINHSLILRTVCLMLHVMEMQNFFCKQ